MLITLRHSPSMSFVSRFVLIMIIIMMLSNTFHHVHLVVNAQFAVVPYDHESTAVLPNQTVFVCVKSLSVFPRPCRKKLDRRNIDTAVRFFFLCDVADQVLTLYRCEGGDNECKNGCSVQTHWNTTDGFKLSHIDGLANFEWYNKTFYDLGNDGYWLRLREYYTYKGRGRCGRTEATRIRNFPAAKNVCYRGDHASTKYECRSGMPYEIHYPGNQYCNGGSNIRYAANATCFHRRRKFWTCHSAAVAGGTSSEYYAVIFNRNGVSPLLFNSGIFFVVVVLFLIISLW